MELLFNNSAQKGCEIVQTKSVNGIDWLQIKTLKTGKLWPVQFKVFAERFASEQYTTEDARKCKTLDDLKGLVFNVTPTNDNPF